jgi:hypothetical protein
MIMMGPPLHLLVEGGGEDYLKVSLRKVFISLICGFL